MCYARSRIESVWVGGLFYHGRVRTNRRAGRRKGRLEWTLEALLAEDGDVEDEFKMGSDGRDEKTQDGKKAPFCGM